MTRRRMSTRRCGLRLCGRCATAILLTVVMVSVPTRPAVGQELEFPEDEGMHPDADFEMWSLLAHLESAEGRRLGVGLIFFTGRIVGLGVSGTFHLIADETSRDWTAERDLVVPIFGRSNHTRGRLDESYDRSRLWRDPASGQITAAIRTGETEITLAFTPTLPPADFGIVPVGEGANQRIYALPAGRIEGTIALDGQAPEAVEGTALFQHAWGESPDPAQTGSLFSANLDDGRAVTAYHGDQPGSVHALSLGGPEGVIMVTEAFSAEPSRTLSSGNDATIFPLDWRLRTRLEGPEATVDIQFETTTGGQPVEVLGVPFWVGRCTVSGRVGDAPVQGSGYVLVRGSPRTEGSE